MMMMEESNCTCSVPCSRISYEPALSYAQLSKFSVERLVLQDPVRRKAVWEQYKKAREDFQRVDTITSEYDTASLNEITENTQILSDTLASVIQNLSTETMETSISGLYEALTTDSSYLKHEVKDEVEDTIEDMAEAVWQYRYSLPALWSFVQGIQDNMEDHDTLAAYVIDCMYAARTVDDRDDSGYVQGWDPANLSPQDQKDAVKRECTQLPCRIESVLNMAEAYTSGIDVLFSSDPTHIDEHNRCLQQLAQTEDQSFINKTEELYELLKELFQAPDADSPQLMILAERIVELANDTQLVHMDDLYIAVGDWCTWVWEEEPENIKNVADSLSSAANSITSIASTYTYYSDTIDQMKTLLTDNLNATLCSVDYYLAGDYTKLEMSEVFGDFVSTTALDDLKSAQMTLDSLSMKIKEGFYGVDLLLQVASWELFGGKIPILNTERLNNMEILSFSLTLGSESINAFHSNVTEDPTTYFPLITSGIVSHIREPLMLMEEEVSAASLEATSVLTRYTADMKTYEAEMTMDEEFFMCV